MIPEFGHDGFHGALIFFQKNTKLFVFIKKCLILNNELGVHTLQFGVKYLCGQGSALLRMRNVNLSRPFDMSVLYRLRTKPELACTAWSW